MARDVGVLIAVAQQQRVVLVGLDQLLAAALAAHHQQATVGDEVGRRDQAPQAREQAPVELADQARDAFDLDAAIVQQRQHGVDAFGGCLQLGHRAGIVDLQRDDVRMVGDEADQVQLAEQAQHPGVTRAIAHQQPVHAVAHHQPQRLEQLGIGMDLDQVELRHLAHGQHGRRHVAQQRIAQIGGGEDPQARRTGTVVAHQGIVHPMRRQLAAHRHQVECTIDDSAACANRHRVRARSPARASRAGLPVRGIPAWGAAR